MAAPSIVVIGLGAMGSAALYRLARRGVRAIGIEQYDIGHDRGSSHGPTRVIRLAHFENRSYVPLMRRAYELWHELERVSGETLLRKTGIAEIGRPDGKIMEQTQAAAKEYGLDVEVLGAEAMMKRYPAFRLPKDFIAVLQPDGGYIEAERAIAANIRVAKAAGAVVRVKEKVLEIKTRSDGISIKTERGQIDADGAIITAGPWMNFVLRNLGLHLPLTVTRQVVGWFKPMDAAAFSADRFPVFIIGSDYGNHYGFPSYGDMGVKIAKHNHLDEEVASPDDYDQTISEKDKAAITAPLEEFLPGLKDRMQFAQTCLYTMTADDRFIIGCPRGFSRIVVASPCCGYGFKFSPFIGERLADLALGGEPSDDIAQFLLDRFV
jgi:sarcosine oxidase